MNIERDFIPASLANIHSKRQQELPFDTLVDICDVVVDKSLPKHERLVEFIRQIKNPYMFKCGNVTVAVEYSQSGKTLEDCLQMLLTH